MSASRWQGRQRLVNLTRCGVRAVVAPAVRGGRGRRGRAGGHGARARHERWQQWRGQSGLAAAAGAGVAGAAPVAGPDKIIDPCTAGAGSHGSSRPPVTRRAVASPLTSHLSPLGPAGPAREGSTANSSSFSNLFWRSWGHQAGGGCRGCQHSMLERNILDPDFEGPAGWTVVPVHGNQPPTNHNSGASFSEEDSGEIF